jgi:predicted dehydrogenase
MSAKAVCEQFGFGYCSESVDALIGDDGINSVLIATRHNLHGPLVHKVLEAGKHVFVEKPLCLDSEELRKIAQSYETCVQRGKTPVLAVGFNRRFSPFIQRIRSALENRRTPLIASYRVNAGFIPMDSWVQDPIEGGGRIIGEVCHFVDTLRFLVGAPIRTVQAASIQADDVRLSNRDSIAVTLTYHDGSVASILYHALGNSDFPKEKLEISAGGEVIVLEDFCKLEIFGRRKEKIKARQDKGFDAEIAAFVNAVVNGGPAPIPFSEILEATETTFAIHQALDTGQVICPDKRNS